MNARINHRHVLTRLAVGPIYESDSDYWITLKSEFERVRTHFSDMGLALVIDESGGYAYLRQAADETDEGWSESGFAPLSRILRRSPLSYHQTIFLVLLRERLLRHEQSPDTEVALYLDMAEITEMLRLFYPDTNNEKQLYSSIQALVGRFTKLHLLAQMKNRSEPIYRVEPIIKAKLPPEMIDEVRRRLGKDSNQDNEDNPNDDESGAA